MLAGLVDFARKHRVWILIGSLAIRKTDGSIANRSFFLNDAGNIVSRYDKIHMFDIDLSDSVSYRESDTITPGGAAVLVDRGEGGCRTGKESSGKEGELHGRRWANTLTRATEPRGLGYAPQMTSKRLAIF